MKLSILLIIFLAGCSAIASDGENKPRGEQVFDILLTNTGLLLAREPLCDMKSATRKDQSITLGQHLATILSVSYESENSVEIKSSCARSKHETENKEILDIWDCNIEVLEKNQEGKFISSSMIAFSTDLYKTGLMRGSLRCF